MFLTTVYSCWTELFEIEMIVCIKMDLALNNQQRLICHKNTPTNERTNQPTNEPTTKIHHWTNVFIKVYQT